MTEQERHAVSQEERKEKIRARYRGVDRNELEFIPAKQKEKLFEDTGTKRVCAYCRVSTDDVNQTSSYELQKNHYEDMIKEHQGWELVGIYADEGISGTSLKHRDEFNRMIEDCKAGKIDLIVTKSVSRFARNIVDCIAKVRELANMIPQVGVFFETEHIYTLDKGVVKPASSMIPQTDFGKFKSLLINTAAPPMEIPIRYIGTRSPNSDATQFAQSQQSHFSKTPSVEIFPPLSSCARKLTSRRFHPLFSVIL